MSQEIELKLALAAETPALLDAHPALAGCPREDLTLGNRYFDTPKGELRKRRVALRVRHQRSGTGETRTLQTLKSAAASTGGLSRRGEWEWPIDSIAQGPEGLDIAGLEALSHSALEGIALDALVPLFSTDFSRRVWRLSEGESDIELALDEGEIVAGERRLSICEMELELKRGEPAALYALARRLCADGALDARPANHSKASRANSLIHAPPRPDTPARVSLDALIDAIDSWEDSADPAWYEAALARLAALQATLTGDAAAHLAPIGRTLAAGGVPWQAADWLALRALDI